MRLCTQLAGIDIRPFQVHAKNARFAGSTLPAGAANVFHDLFDLRHRRGHRGGKQGSGAMAGMDFRHQLGSVAAVHHVGATSAMHMEIDKAGQ